MRIIAIKNSTRFKISMSKTYLTHDEPVRMGGITYSPEMHGPDYFLLDIPDNILPWFAPKELFVIVEEDTRCEIEEDLIENDIWDCFWDDDL